MKWRNICRNEWTYSPPVEGFTTRVSSRRGSFRPATNAVRSRSTCSHRLRTSARLRRSVPCATAGLPSQPAMQPQLLGPHNVTERSMNPAKTALQVAKVLIVRQLGDRVEDDAVRPGVVVEQLQELVHPYRAGASSPASITESFTCFPSITCWSPMTDPPTFAFFTRTPLPRMLLAIVLPSMELPASIATLGPIVASLSVTPSST